MITKTFRLFISSTFSDFLAEREALQRRVFPELEKFCAERGGRFQAIDLRWGITEEAQQEHDTLRICLEEVRRCQKLSPRPNFAVLLGDRYGWEPVPARIPLSHWERLRAAVSNQDWQLIENSYQLDENAIPPVYCLRKRTKNLTAAFAHEARLLKLLRSAARGFRGSARLPYFASATHQEIALGALAKHDARSQALNPEQHVHVYMRHLDGLPLDATAKDFIDWDADTDQEVSGARNRLRSLEAQLRRQLGDRVHDLRVSWSRHGRNGAVSKAYLNRFCDAFLDHQKQLIDAELAVMEQADERQQRDSAHKEFGAERARVFAGRKIPLARIARYTARGLTYDGNLSRKSGSRITPLIILGSGGSGKSALLARAAQQDVQQSKRSGAIVLQRYIGGVPGTESLMTTLTDLTADIATLYGQPQPPTPENVKALAEGFRAALGYALAKRPLILYLDALDQLDNVDGVLLDWLPKELPMHVRVVVSTRAGTRVEQSARRRYPRSLIEVPAMRHTEGKAMLNAWLADKRAAWFNAGISPSQGRRLTKEQQQSVIAAFYKNGSPLWLKLAYEEAATWASWDKPQKLPNTVQGLIRDLVDKRLIKRENHPQIFAERALAYLAAGRLGLSEIELGISLGTDRAVRTEFEALEKTRHKWGDDKILPPILWSRLFFDLQPYLGLAQVDGALLMRWFHREFVAVLKARFLGSEEQRGAIHGSLAKTFQASVNLVRRVREEPFHREVTKDDRGLLESFADFRFSETYIVVDKFEMLRQFIRMDIKPEKFFLGRKKSQPIHSFLDFAKGQEFHRDFGIDVVGISSDSDEPISDFEISYAEAGYSVKGRMLLARLVRGRNVGAPPRSNENLDTVGAWQFLRRTTLVCGQKEVGSFSQRHFPRYLIAACLRQQDHFFTSEYYDVPTQATWFPFPVLIRGRNKLSGTFDGIKFDFQESFIKKMKEDLIFLEAAVSKIENDASGLMTISGVRTFSGQPIFSKTTDLLRAIAFEAVILGEQLTDSHGIYRGYCLLDEWNAGSQKVKLTSTLLEEQLGEDQKKYDVDYINKLNRIQMNVFGEIIWAENPKSSFKRNVDIVINSIDKLSLPQKAQLLLMVDFFQVPFLQLLPPILGAELFSDFVERGCRGFQPDSIEEQEVRIGVAYIELLGDLLQGDIYS